MFARGYIARECQGPALNPGMSDSETTFLKALPEFILDIEGCLGLPSMEQKGRLIVSFLRIVQRATYEKYGKAQGKEMIYNN